MAPSKKSKTVGKFKKKPKLVDMLGPQWTKQELERFYQGFTKHGSDWNKVATMVPNRSPVMLEAKTLDLKPVIFQAYFSLPEGTTTVVGFIALVTDHYNKKLKRRASTLKTKISSPEKTK